MRSCLGFSHHKHGWKVALNHMANQAKVDVCGKGSISRSHPMLPFTSGGGVDG